MQDSHHLAGITWLDRFRPQKHWGRCSWKAIRRCVRVVRGGKNVKMSSRSLGWSMQMSTWLHLVLCALALSIEHPPQPYYTVILIHTIE